MPVPSHGSEIEATVRSIYSEHSFYMLSDDTLAERRALLYTVSMTRQSCTAHL